MNYPVVKASCIVLREYEVLLERNAGLWDIPTKVVGRWGKMMDVAKEAVYPTGVTVQPSDGVLFVSEDMNSENHDILVYLLGTYVKGEPTGTSAKWVDVRKLGELEKEMTPVAVDALLKFSQWLMIQNKHKTVATDSKLPN